MTRLNYCLVAAGILALGACGGASDSDSTTATDAPEEATSTEATPATTESAVAPSTSEPDAEVVASRCGTGYPFQDIACDELHDAEFAGLVELPATFDDISALTACGPVVEELTGRAASLRGVDVGFGEADDPASLECWATVQAPGALSASIRDDGLEAALGEFAVLADVEPGTCVQPYDFGTGLRDIVVSADCGAEGAILVAGQADAPDGPVPDDETYDDFLAQCGDLAGSTPGASEEVGILLPDDASWEALGRRTVICLAEPAVADTDPSGAVGAACANYDEELQDYPTVPCDEPHSAEFAGVVPPPVDVLPDDRDDAVEILNAACRPVVERLIGRSLSEFGSGLGFVTETGLGEPLVGDVRCYVSVTLEDALIASIADVGYEEALNYEIVADFAPGTCFAFVGDSFLFAEELACDAPDALMAVGDFVLDDPPGTPYPGVDALRAVRTERCSTILADSELAADPASVSGILPSESEWVSYDQRVVTCDAVPR